MSNHVFIQLEKRLDDYKLRASEIHGQIENIKRQHPDSNDNEEISNVLEIAVEEILRPVSPISSPQPSLKRESVMEEMPFSGLSPPPPPPIPPPPLIGGGSTRKYYFQKQPPELFYKKDVLKNFAKFTEFLL